MATLSESLGAAGGAVMARSKIVASRPLGPSLRRYANAAVVLRCALDPHALLALLQGVERLYGRQRRGQAWGPRTLDCDIVLWGGGAVRDAQLTIPHPRFRGRAFVLGPAAAIAPHWIDPQTGFSLRALHVRLTRARPLPR